MEQTECTPFSLEGCPVTVLMADENFTNTSIISLNGNRIIATKSKVPTDQNVWMTIGFQNYKLVPIGQPPSQQTKQSNQETKQPIYETLPTPNTGIFLAQTPKKWRLAVGFSPKFEGQSAVSSFSIDPLTPVWRCSSIKYGARSLEASGLRG